MKLLHYIAPILFQFYAYQQYKHNYDYSGLIVIEAKDNDKLKDLVPNCKQGARMELYDNKMISVLYLSNETMIKSYFKAIQMKNKCYNTHLNAVNIIKNDSKNKTKGIWFPMFISVKPDNWICSALQTRPNLCNDIKTEGLRFEQNMNKSGMSECPLLNIKLKEQIVFAMDFILGMDM